MLDGISNKFSDLIRKISGKASISEKNVQDAVEEIKLALLDADVNLRVVRRFINSTLEEAVGEKVLRAVNPGQQFTKIVYDKMVSFLGDEKQNLQLKGPDTLSTILMLGLQGSGKTTASAKLANKLKNEGRKVLLVAADLVRPAAVEQLRILGGQIGVEVYSEETKDPARVVRNALGYANKNQFNVLIADTSGRLHLDDVMMQELEDIKRVLDPTEALLVADSMTGQHAADIAKEFNERVGISGIILSKFDSDTRGGAALSLKTITGKPIKFIGTGEKIQDLDAFYPDRIASRILGMGDIVSFVEKAQEAVDAEEAAKLQEKINKAAFTLEDYLDQFSRIRKMGSLKSVVDMIPGLKGNIDEDKLDDSEMKREEAIILSMTKMERQNHRIIGPSRRKRIAKGCGMSVGEVSSFLKKFDKTRLMMKKVSKNKKYQSDLMSKFGG